MDTINIKGKEYPFWFAIKANREMSKVDLKEKDDIYFIFLGLKYGAMHEKQPFELTEDMLLDLFEDDLKGYGDACKLLDEQMGKLREARGITLKK